MPRLTDLMVSFISLVKNPANMKDIIVKSSSDKKVSYNLEKIINIQKSAPEGLVYGTVYKANEVDAQGDWADIETIRKAAHEFMQKCLYENVDENHNCNKSGAKVVESYVTDNEWNVVIKCDPKSEYFEKIQKGEYKGLSMYGTAVKKNENAPTQDNRVDLENLQKQIKELHELNKELFAIVKGIPQTKQIEFDKDGNAITKSSGDIGLLGEFSMVEVE